MKSSITQRTQEKRGVRETAAYLVFESAAPIHADAIRANCSANPKREL